MTEQQLEWAEGKLRSVFRWIESRSQDGFIDSKSHEQNLDIIFDALCDRLEELDFENARLRSRDTAHEIWAAAQLMPQEGIEDGVDRIMAILLNAASEGRRSEA